MNLLQILLDQIAFFSTVLLTGFLAVKVGIIKSENVDGFAKVMIRVIVSVMTLTIVVSSGTREQLFTMGPFCLAVALMFAILMVIGFMSAKLLGLKSPIKNAHICSCSFVNSAILGYPIIIAMFPEESGMAIATFLVVETIITWTVGVGVLVQGTGEGKVEFKKMVTPVTLCLALALVMILLDIHPSGIVWDSLTGLGGTQRYVGLLYIGMDIGRRGFKKLFENPKVFLVSPFKLIIGPLAVFLILRALNIVDYNHLLIITVFSMLPTMMIITALSQEYNCAPEYASAGLLSTTVLSLVTMPFVFWLVTSVF